MLDAVLELIQTVIGTSLDVAGKLGKQKPELRREAAQGLLSFYQDLEMLKINAEIIEQEINWIITFHRNNELGRHSIENYIDRVNDAHLETMRILGQMFIEYSPSFFWTRFSSHRHSIMRFLEIKNQKLYNDICRLLGNKYFNICTLLTCFDLIDRKQTEKSLRKLEYLASIRLLKLELGKIPRSFDYSIESLKKIGAIRTRTLDADNVNELIRFNKRVRRFINRADAIRERIREFMAQNFEIEDLF